MIDLFKVFMANTVGDKVKKVLESGYIGEGETVKQFESTLKTHFCSDFLVSMNSGTSALHLAMRLIEKTNIRDTIVTTPLTCTATNWPALANGFKLKWVDIDSKNLNIDLDDLERKLDEHSAAILFVHWGGYPVDLDRVATIQKKYEERYGYKIPVIEDCAHAFGSKYKNKIIGSHGNYNTFSFQAIKHLTCGDGGALILPTEEQYKRAKLLRWYGIDRESNRKDFRCLHPNTLIRFEDNTTIPIKDVVQNKIDKPIQVFSDGIWKTTNITDWISSDLGDRVLVNVFNIKTKRKYSTKLTSDHLVLKETGEWTQIKDITTNDKILTSFPKYNSIQLQVLLGSLLGDGNFRTKQKDCATAVFQEGHSPKQLEYLSLKNKVLSSLGSKLNYVKPSKSQKIPDGKYQLHTRILPCLGDLFKLFYNTNIKTVPIDLISSNFSDLFLAIWFMDDGSLSVKNGIDKLVYDAQIATNSFSEKDVLLLIDLLNTNGFECYIVKDKIKSAKNHGNRIFFTRKGTEKLLTSIARYVPSSMRYKVGHRIDVDVFDSSLWNEQSAEAYYDNVIIESMSSNYKTVYCLKVEDSAANFQTSSL